MWNIMEHQSEGKPVSSCTPCGFFWARFLFGKLLATDPVVVGSRLLQSHDLVEQKLVRTDSTRHDLGYKLGN
jgi:hypothetical protein